MSSSHSVGVEFQRQTFHLESLNARLSAVAPILFYLIMGSTALLLQLALGQPLAALWGPGLFALEWELGAGLSLGLSAVLLSRWLGRRFEWGRLLDPDFREKLQMLRTAQLLSLALMSALGEELLFRGFLQPQVGLFASSLLFGLAHLPQRRFQLPWTLAAVFMGFAFGLLFENFGSLFAPIVAHFSINYFNLHYLLRPLTPEEL